MSETYRQPAGPTTGVSSDRISFRFVLVIWMVMTILNVVYILLYCANMPWGDEWWFIAALTGEEPFGPWLWELHNEHRVPLPRLIYYGLFQLTLDFRSGCWLISFCLAASALILIREVRRLRGRSHWADAYFPIALLHWGHYENMLMGYQLFFSLVLLLQVLIAVRMLRWTPQTSFRRGVEVGLLLWPLMLCGGPGVVLSLMTALWLVWLAFSQRSVRSLVLLGLALVPMVYFGIYIDGYQKPPAHPDPAGVWPAVSMTFEVLTMSYGMPMRHIWPISGLLVAVAIGLGVGRLIWVIFRCSSERQRAVGLLILMAATGALCFVIGWGRSGFGSGYGFWSRYAMFAWPAIGITYLAWLLPASEGSRRSGLVTIILFVGCLLVLIPNIAYGFVNGRQHQRWANNVQHDLRTDQPLDAIIQERFGRSYIREWAREGIPKLRDKGVDAFRDWDGPES